MSAAALDHLWKPTSESSTAVTYRLRKRFDLTRVEAGEARSATFDANQALFPGYEATLPRIPFGFKDAEQWLCDSTMEGLLYVLELLLATSPGTFRQDAKELVEGNVPRIALLAVRERPDLEKLRDVALPKPTRGEVEDAADDAEFLGSLGFQLSCESGRHLLTIPKIPHLLKLWNAQQLPPLKILEVPHVSGDKEYVQGSLTHDAVVAEDETVHDAIEHLLTTLLVARDDAEGYRASKEAWDKHLQRYADLLEPEGSEILWATLSAHIDLETSDRTHLTELKIPVGPATVWSSPAYRKEAARRGYTPLQIESAQERWDQLFTTSEST